MDSKEIWVDVPEYEHMYKISNYGNIKSFKNKNPKTLKQCKNKHGYLTVGLSKDGIRKTFSSHQLMAISFLNHKPNKHNVVIDHIDSNKLNNTLKNLRLITQRENTSKKRFKHTSSYTGVSWHKARNKWRAAAMINGKVKHIGLFKCEYSAYVAYQKAVKNIF